MKFLKLRSTSLEEPEKLEFHFKYKGKKPNKTLLRPSYFVFQTTLNPLFCKISMSSIKGIKSSIIPLYTLDPKYEQSVHLWIIELYGHLFYINTCSISHTTYSSTLYSKHKLFASVQSTTYNRSFKYEYEKHQII